MRFLSSRQRAEKDGARSQKRSQQMVLKTRSIVLHCSRHREVEAIFKRFVDLWRLFILTCFRSMQNVGSSQFENPSVAKLGGLLPSATAQVYHAIANEQINQGKTRPNAKEDAFQRTSIEFIDSSVAAACQGVLHRDGNGCFCVDLFRMRAAKAHRSQPARRCLRPDRWSANWLHAGFCAVHLLRNAGHSVGKGWVQNRQSSAASPRTVVREVPN